MFDKPPDKSKPGQIGTANFPTASVLRGSPPSTFGTAPKTVGQTSSSRVIFQQPAISTPPRDTWAPPLQEGHSSVIHEASVQATLPQVSTSQTQNPPSGNFLPSMMQNQSLQLRELDPSQMRQLVDSLQKVIHPDGLYDNKKIIIPTLAGNREFRTDARRSGQGDTYLHPTEAAYLLSQIAKQLHERHGSQLENRFAAFRELNPDQLADAFDLAESPESAQGVDSAISSRRSWQKVRDLIGDLDTATARLTTDNNPAQNPASNSGNQETVLEPGETEEEFEGDPIDDPVNWSAEAANDPEGGSDSSQDTDVEKTDVLETEEEPKEDGLAEEENLEKEPEPKPEDQLTNQNPVPPEPELDIALSPDITLEAPPPIQSSTPPSQSQTGVAQPLAAPTNQTTIAAEPPLIDRSFLVDSFAQSLSHEYVGQFLAGESVPSELQAELRVSIEAYLQQNFSPQELDKISIRPDLRDKLLATLDQKARTSHFNQSTTKYLEEYFANNQDLLPSSMRERLAAQLQNKKSQNSFQSKSPIQTFVEQATADAGTQNQGVLLSANLQSIEPALEALIVVSGEDAAFKLFSEATPEQARVLLNIPDGFSLTTDQLAAMKFSAAQAIPQLAARLRLEAESKTISAGYLNPPKISTPKNTSRALSPIRTPEEVGEEVAALSDLGSKTKLAKALGSSKNGTQKKLDRLQLLVEGTWDRLKPEEQRKILEDNGYQFPQNYDRRDRIKMSAAIAGIFINYDQKALDKLSDSVARMQQQSVPAQEALTDDLKTIKAALQAHQETTEGIVVGERVTAEILQGFSPKQSAIIQKLVNSGELRAEYSTDQLEESLGPNSESIEYETPGAPALDYFAATEQLSWDQETYQQYSTPESSSPTNRFFHSFPGVAGLQQQRLNSGASVSSRVRSIKNTAKNIQDLRNIALSLSTGNWAGAALSALRSPGVRKALGYTAAAGAGLAAIPFIPAAKRLLDAYNYIPRVGSVPGLELGGSGVSGAGASGPSGASAQALNTSASTPTSSATASTVSQNSAAQGVGGASNTTLVAGGTEIVKTTGIGFLTSFSGIFASSMFGYVVFSTFMVFIVIQGAFLIPTPSLLPTQSPYETISQSKYAVLSKKAAPKKAANNAATDIVYTIEFSPKSDYKLEITDVADIYGFLGEGDSSKIDGTDPAYPKITSPLTKEVFGSGTIESQITRRYTQRLEAVDTLVLNTITITFNVLDENGTVIATGEKMSNTAGVRIGNPKTGCWPTTGEITQGPRSGNSTHILAEAFDIEAPTGTPIYAPFSGQACNNVYPFSPKAGYGHHVVITFDYNGLTLKAVFAHMHTKTDLGATGCREVTEGEKIGIVGSTGNSTGPHLHYEIRKEGLPAGMGIRDFLAEGPTAQVGNKVQSCYD